MRFTMSCIMDFKKQWSPAGSDVEACNLPLGHSSGDACPDNCSEHDGLELDLSVASTDFSTEGVGRSQRARATRGRLAPPAATSQSACDLSAGRATGPLSAPAGVVVPSSVASSPRGSDVSSTVQLQATPGDS
jgi:hypothetical protein